VLWVLFSEFPQKLGYLQTLLWRKKKRVWLWGGNTTITEQKSLGCGSSTNNIKDFMVFNIRVLNPKNRMLKSYIG
jgi:hypothetical protein